MDELVAALPPEGPRPKVLLHVCCAPCFSGCIESLADWADITLLFYNPNMDTAEEYRKRAVELRRFCIDAKLPVEVVVEDFDPKPFYDLARGLENVPEGGERCFKCYELRMREAAIYARDNGFDYFTTTLTLSPLKNAAKINDIGEMLGAVYGVKHLPSDFKKKDGYKRSIELSKEYNLYRQNYCGCVYSRRDALA